MLNIKIFVIIVTYKGHRWYERCFNSLRDSEYPVKTIVIDNASNDGTIEYIREHFPEIHLIESKENLGFGRANNLGMRYALDQGCDYVFLLNQDAWIESNTLGELIRVHQKNQDFGILSPMHLVKEKDALEYSCMRYIFNSENTDPQFIFDLVFGNVNDIYIIKYINAAGWLLPRNILETIGGFCPLIYHYGEDDDYLNRLRYHNIKIGICPHSRMVHDTKNRLENSNILFEKANNENIDNLLDINRTLDLKVLLNSYRRKMLMALVRFNMKKYMWYKHQLRLLKTRYDDIMNCREQHKLKQANWL